jgi:hypothetical protein
MTRFYHNSKPFRRFDSVLFKNTYIFLAAALFFLLFSITSCEENPTILGIKLLPESDFVKFKSDTSIKVEGYTLYSDSSVTNNRTYSYLGKLHDPYFGDTKADFVGQIRLLGPFHGGGAIAVDSAKLFFAIQGAKGTLDSNIIHRIKLYEITEKLSYTTSYYSNRDPNAGMLIGTFALPPIVQDTIKSISLVLPVSFGEYLRDTTKLNQEDDANDFRSFFKGIYFTMEDSPTPLLVATSFAESNFFIRVYYHDGTGTALTYDFVINSTLSKSIVYNRYTRDFTTADPALKIKHINDGVKDSLIYLQAKFRGLKPSRIAYHVFQLTRQE